MQSLSSIQHLASSGYNYIFIVPSNLCQPETEADSELQLQLKRRGKSGADSLLRFRT